MPDKSKKEKKPFRLQEHVEWIAVAFVLALTVRCFIVEAYQIPTGSMAPTLYGEHSKVTCAECEVEFNVGMRNGQSQAYGFACPSCEMELSPASVEISTRGGDRILVAKHLYLFEPPRRWDVFLFKSPEVGKEHINFVKRLVGLPGERIEIKSGQVFIDGILAAKPERIQSELWQDVYSGEKGHANNGLWRVSGGWEVRPEGLLLSGAGDSWETVEYSRGIYDFYPYNGRLGENVVSDLMVSGHVKMESADGAFAAAIWADNRTAKAVFTPAGSGLLVTLRINEAQVTEARIPLVPNREFSFSFASVDGRSKVRVNGAAALEYVETVRAEDTPIYVMESGVFLQGIRSPILVSDVTLKRDIYYGTATMQRPDRVVSKPYSAEIPEGCYFAMGDNSPVSNDSRVWGFVPKDNILGKAFFLFWPPTRVRPVY